jgi:hypothetical protein
MIPSSTPAAARPGRFLNVECNQGLVHDPFNRFHFGLIENGQNSNDK